jgi:hypothetical protein
VGAEYRRERPFDVVVEPVGCGADVRADGHAGRALLIEYSAPDDADLFDETVWWSCMPALGQTISVESIRADLASMGPEQFSRAYLNRRPSVDDTGWRIIPKDIWLAAGDDD